MRKIIDKKMLVIWTALTGLLFTGPAAYAQSTFPSSPTPFYPPAPSSSAPPPYTPIPPQTPPGAPPAPSGGTKEKGVVNPRDGAFYPGTYGGVINPQTGVVLPKVEGGYMNPQTGEVIPRKE